MCFVWIWEQTAIISLYSINWLVCITETECVFCAVRTGSLYIIQVICFVWISELTAIISLYSINWLVFINETECVYCAVRTGSLYIIQVICFVWIWEQTAIVSLYRINWLVCITETECVYCPVRTECLYIIQVNVCFCWPFRRLVADLSLRRLVFDPRSGQVGLTVDKMSLGRIFLGVFRFCPVTIIPPKLRNHLNLHVALPRSIKGRTLGTFQKAIPIPKSGSIE